MMPPTILIAGISSGVGKTTVALGLMALLSRRYKVQPFKVGPDFIDPSHHTYVCGRPSRNLDSYIMGEKGVLETFKRASSDADFCIIEGVMGLYDGIGSTEVASTAHVAKILKVPVVLVINAHGVSRSIAAMVKGFMEFDDVDIKGLILNNTGGEKHVRLIRESLRDSGIIIPIIGGIPRVMSLRIPSRYLGLHMAKEVNQNITVLSDVIEKYVDIETLKTIAYPPENDIELKEYEEEFNLKIGIAWDNAFCFYYQDSLDDLRKRGAELVFFSPISDDLPHIDGIYIGGGYPELYAKELEASATRNKIKKAAYDGMPIYGECGALLYLSEELETDKRYRMAGILPASSRMTDKLQALGYTEAEVVCNNCFAREGKVIRGHEFHYSITECERDACFGYKLSRGKGIYQGMDGLIEHNTMASYMHTHPASSSFEEFLRSCSGYKAR